MKPLGSGRLYDAAWHLRGLLELAKTRDLDVDALKHAAGLTTEQFQEPSATVAFECIEIVAETVSRLTGDPFAFMHSAATQSPRDIGLLGYHALSAPTMKELFEHAYAGMRELCNVLETKVDFSGSEGRLTLLPEVSVSRVRGLAEAIMACFVHLARQLADPDFRPRTVSFMHAAVPDEGPYQRLFRCALRYEQPVYEIAFDPDLGRMRPHTCDPKLHAVLQPYVSMVTAQNTPGPARPFHVQVRQRLTQLLTGRAPNLEEVADALGIKPRTLQHRLAQEGKRYRALLDEARRDVALATVLESKDITALAIRLGYQDNAAFYRAFRRWTGTTPASFRLAHGQVPKASVKGTKEAEPDMPPQDD